jgi:hypothetical protein
LKSLLVIIELKIKTVVHVNVTRSPSLSWLKQQIRDACPWDGPRFIIHDNDGIRPKCERVLRARDRHLQAGVLEEPRVPPDAGRMGELIGTPILGGLHHDYHLAAARPNAPDGIFADHAPSHQRLTVRV